MMEFLRRLACAYGPSGNEDEVAGIIIDEIRRDRLGSIIAVKRGKKRGKLMVSTYMDQTGVMVTQIDKSGYIRFNDVGSLNPYNVLYHNVVFKNGVTGVMTREEKESADDLMLEELYIDIGALSREDAMKKVGIGDFGIFKSDFIRNGDRIISGTLDARIGCCVVAKSIKEIKDLSTDTYFVFNVQEESYSSGSAVSAYEIGPDCAICVGITGTDDTPNSKSMAVNLGCGPAVKIMSARMICHPRVKDYLIATAKKYDIKYQIEVSKDKKIGELEIQTSRAGVPTGIISIPVRHSNTPGQIADIHDIEYSSMLLTKAIEDYIDPLH